MPRSGTKPIWLCLLQRPSCTTASHLTVLSRPHWTAESTTPTVIALVSLREAVGQSETIHSDAGVAPTYRPALMFRFDVIEYLKGAGEDEIVVRDPSSHTFLTSKEALEEAEHHLAVRRNSTWDDRAAVVFLHQIQVGDSGDGTTDASHVRHGFTTINSLWGQHTIDDLGKAWLSANVLTPDGQDVGDFIRSAGNDLELLTDSVKGGVKVGHVGGSTG